MSELSRWIEACEECQSLDQVNSVLEGALLEAPDDAQIYQGLLDLSDYFAKRGYRDWQVWLLDQLYQLTHKKKVAYYLAKACFQLADYPSAYEWLSRAKTDQAVFLVQWLEAQILFELGQVKACQKVLQDLIQTYPTRFEPYQLLAQVKIEEGDYSKAKAYYQVLLDYFSDKVDRALIRQRLLALALEDEMIQLEWIQSLVSWEDLPLVSAEDYYLLAMAYQKAGHLALAYEAAQQALALDLDSVDIHYLAAELALGLGHQASLRENLDWLFQVTLADDGRMADYLALCQAIDYLTPAIKDKLLDAYLLQEDEDLTYAIATYLIAWLGQHEGAQAALEVLDSMAPDFPDPEYLSCLYAPLYAELNQRDQAQAAYQEALDLMAGDQDFWLQARQYFEAWGLDREVATLDRILAEADHESQDIEV